MHACAGCVSVFTCVCVCVCVCVLTRACVCICAVKYVNVCALIGWRTVNEGMWI